MKQSDPIIERMIRRIESLMAEKNVKPAPLAKAAQLNVSAIRDIFRGRSQNPGVVTIEKIARMLGTTSSYLLRPDADVPVTGIVAPDGFSIRWVPEEEVANFEPLQLDFQIDTPGSHYGIGAPGGVLMPVAKADDIFLFEKVDQPITQTGNNELSVFSIDDTNSVLGVKVFQHRIGENSIVSVSGKSLVEVSSEMRTIGKYVSLSRKVTGGMIEALGR